MHLLVDALVLRVDNVRRVRDLQQVAVAEGLGYQLFRFAKGSEGVRAVADYEYRYTCPVE